MAESNLVIKASFDATEMIAGLRRAADALESARTAPPDSAVTLAEALDEVEGLVQQHCFAVGDHYETGALSANRDAFDLLVRAGRAEYVGNAPFGRMATVRLIPRVVTE